MCVLNGRKTTRFFKLERGTQQSDPISAYLFILFLEIVFIVIKTNTNIEVLNIFNHNFLYTVYADDTTFFIKNTNSATEIVKTLDNCSLFSGLKIKTKCEIAGIGVLKVVKLALCGMKCVNLNNDVIKILGICCSYDKKLENEKNFLNHIIKLQNVLNMWRMRNLSLLGKISIFKTLAFSKIIHLTLVTSVPSSTIDLLNKMQKDFLWDKKNATLCCDYTNGGLKSVDIFSKIVSLQCSWVRQLFNNNFHQWKVIPRYLIQKYLCKNFKFHSNLDLRKSRLRKFPKYYQKMLYKWGKFLSSSPCLPSAIISQLLWFNKKIQIDKTHVFFLKFVR